MTERWEVRQDPKDPNAWDVYCGVQKIAHLPWQQKAHADLIAAAPELLKALEYNQDLLFGLLDYFEPGHELEQIQIQRENNARLLAKAESTK